MDKKKEKEIQGEIWHPVPGYEKRYEVSNKGKIRSLGTYRGSDYHKILKPYVSKKGYLYVSLRNGDSRKSFAVHRLVLDAFVGERPPGKQAAHWDGDPSKNNVENLRWATALENIKDRARHGRTARGENQGFAKLDKKAVKTIKSLKGKGLSSGEVAHLACVSQSTIYSIWEGETWKHV